MTLFKMAKRSILHSIDGDIKAQRDGGGVVICAVDVFQTFSKYAMKYQTSAKSSTLHTYTYT